MTSVDTSLQPFVAQLFSTWLFSPLPAEIQKSIASELKLCSFRPGATIYAPNELPSLVHYVIQGRVRILGPEEDSPTVEIAEQGAILGWDSLLRRVPGGLVRAAVNLSEPDVREQDVLTLALSADTFESLALKYLMPALGDRISAFELFDALSRFFASLPTRLPEINLRELVQFIEREQLATVNHLLPKSLKPNSLQKTFLRFRPIGSGCSAAAKICLSFRELSFDRSSNCIPGIPPVFPFVSSASSGTLLRLLCFRVNCLLRFHCLLHCRPRSI